MYFGIVYMDFYFNTSMDSTYAKKYYTLMCFHPPLHIFDQLKWRELESRTSFV
jgi:hypothetical protein